MNSTLKSWNYQLLTCPFANNALLGGGIGVRVWIREERKIKRRPKALLNFWWQTSLLKICSSIVGQQNIEISWLMEHHTQTLCHNMREGEGRVDTGTAGCYGMWPSTHLHSCQRLELFLCSHLFRHLTGDKNGDTGHNILQSLNCYHSRMLLCEIEHVVME